MPLPRRVGRTTWSMPGSTARVAVSQCSSSLCRAAPARAPPGHRPGGAVSTVEEADNEREEGQHYHGAVAAS